MTPEYVRQVVLATWQTPSPTEVDRRIRVCLRRQAVLHSGTPLVLSVVLDEAVLRRSATGLDSADAATIQQGQLARLIEAAALPNVTVQVLPFAAGLPPVSAGSFSLLDSRATGMPDVVYLENKTRIFFVDGETEVDRYVRDFELLTKMALAPAESAEFLRQVAAGAR
jgi:hypothetical protein